MPGSCLFFFLIGPMISGSGYVIPWHCQMWHLLIASRHTQVRH